MKEIKECIDGLNIDILAIKSSDDVGWFSSVYQVNLAITV